MRPSKITICGINSYVTPQTIDFSKLVGSSVFGIFGATGSGKSTILDSIIIALYGNSDRDTLSNVINTHVKDAYIKFEFEIDRDESCLMEVVRTFKVRPSGLTSGATLTDLSNKKILGDTTEKVNQEIEKMLGVGKKEFLKCIALPQNEFDRFLLDTPSDRKKSIAKLFNLEHFGEDLNRKVKNRLDILTVKDAAITEQLKTFEGITDNSQKQLLTEIKLTETLVLTTKNQIKKLEKELKILDEQLLLATKLNEFENKFETLQAQEDYFSNLKIALNNYLLNKENLIKVENLRNKIVKLDDVNSKIKTLEIELELNNKKMQESEKVLTELKNQQSLLVEKQNVFKLELEKKRVLIEEVENIKSTIKELKLEQANLFNNMVQINEQNEKLDKDIFKTVKNLDKVNNKILQNEEEINKINEILVLSESEDFVEKLTGLKYCVDASNLEEVENYRVHKDVNTLFSKINGNIAYYKGKLKKRDVLLAELNTTIKSLNSLLNKCLNKKADLNKELAQLNQEHSNLYGLRVGYNADVTNFAKQIEKIKKNISDYTLKLENKKAKLSQISELVDYSNEISVGYENIENQEVVNLNLNNLLAKNQSTIKALNVEKEYLEEQIESLKNQIPPAFNIETFESEINESNYEALNSNLTEFENQKSFVIASVSDLKEQLKGKSVDVKKVALKQQALIGLQQLLEAEQVKLGISKNTYETNVKLLAKQNELETELHLIHNDLKLTQKLSHYISKNALVDFVSEEYLYLISEYANKYVYKISKGKYMLKYSNKNTGEFVAVDNFNGGIVRSIKTLSGGERFIFSLGLALGVSQSIAINNNKSFNFFFIDEGFGNLSEDYVEDVLACFDRLRTMGFTVGFITHVEKMQEYITNKVVVEKVNNEVGSVVSQY